MRSMGRKTTFTWSQLFRLVFLISEWIGKLKGGSSFYINHEIANRKLLDWQDGYGVVSFGTKDLKWVVDYVKNQKEHHARGTTIKRLEFSDAEISKGR